MSKLSFQYGENKSESALNKEEFCGPINQEPNYNAYNNEMTKNNISMVSPQN